MRPNQDEHTAIGKMLVKAYWQRVSAEQFKTEAFRVFPTSESAEAWKVGKTKMLKNSGEVYDIGAHITKLKDIAEKK